MLLSRTDYEILQQYKELNEKLILFNNGKRYGQIVFMAYDVLPKAVDGLSRSEEISN